ncbi:DUF4037 domain-containing protein [Desulfosarcina ovata]|nr:DUF4037 domain-containing protein [Desulfosarcina ovata]
MKGLELCEKYFVEFGVDMIEKKFPHYKNRIAAGLLGDGSECYGFDDEISKDHDWGPGFCLFLTRHDFEEIGRALQLEYDKLPKIFRGFQRLTSQWGDGRVGVIEIGAYYRRYLGSSQAPKILQQWLSIPEEYLSACISGKVFSDPLRKFSRIRDELLNFYPEDVRLVKISAKCMSCGQSGQYNFMRTVQRREMFAAQYVETKFCSDIISLVFLLNHQYTPYFKWKHRAVRALPILGEFIYSKIADIVSNSDPKAKNAIMNEISSKVINMFRKEGLSNLDSNFLLDHGPVIHQKIKDSDLRKRNVWAG